MADVENKMKKTDFGHCISSLAVWRSKNLTCETETQALKWVLCCMCVSACAGCSCQCAHRHIKHYRSRISKGCGYGLSWWRFLFAGACLSSVTVREHKVFHMWPQWDQNTDSWEARGNFVCNLPLGSSTVLLCVQFQHYAQSINICILKDYTWRV